MAQTQEQGSGGDAVDLARAAELLDAVVRQVDAGELSATSAERAYLAGAARAVRVQADRA